MFTSRMVLPSAMTWTEKSACVANLPRSHKHTRARFLLLLLWCCCIIAVGCGAATTAVVTCNEKKRGKKTTIEETLKMKMEFLWIQKRIRTAVRIVLVWLEKWNNEKTNTGKKKRERHKKKSKQLTTGGFPNNYFSRRQLRAEKGWEVEGYAEHVLRSGRDLSMFIWLITTRYLGIHSCWISYRKFWYIVSNVLCPPSPGIPVFFMQICAGRKLWCIQCRNRIDIDFFFVYPYRIELDFDIGIVSISNTLLILRTIYTLLIVFTACRYLRGALWPYEIPGREWECAWQLWYDTSTQPRISLGGWNILGACWTYLCVCNYREGVTCLIPS